MLLKDMVSDGYYPSLVVDPNWYEGKHPQESLPEIEDPVALWRPAPERDLSGGTLFFRPGDTLFNGFAVRCLAGIDIVSTEFAFAEDADQYALKSDDVTPEPFSTPGGSRRDVRFRPDGLRAWTHWTVAVGGFDTHQYDLPAPWQLTGWTPNGNILRSTSLNRSMTWHDNGTKLTFLSRWFSSFRRIDTFDHSSAPYDISGGLGPSFASLTAITGPGEYMVRFSLDGFKMFTDISATTIQRYNLTVAHDISSSTGVDQSFNYGAAGAGSTNSWDFSGDHTKLYFATGGNLLGSFDLTAADDISAPFNFSTGVNIFLPTNLGVPRGLTIRPDTGDWILLGDQNNQRIRCWET
jgi:hypothetical protein